ncbi:MULTISPECIES: valine--tRNA ligase [Faecalicoccus]|uniref:valine--tRNA ligase n=1 Tax=Faecalicoccus TaxID=1573536 RepID=UPI001E47B27A|nr:MULTISPECIES: valine--tRNA ligase [Faecalicoccus]MCI6378970.1 valine--tRNA ligase [Erysipelotrichaceae bacterium]MDB7985445.1 valine--tRNA ligase [Faecalicoccus pleomorphus]MDY4869558.1 valine--tRNA ligase [Faecalicoccus sp.]
MEKEMAPKYDHLQVESGKYQNWIDQGYFTAGDLSKRPYCIVIPPPNVTGKLHLGHAWDTTLQDIICRYKRLQGYDVLWVAGMDHAGIATQAKVDARLKDEGISRYDIGREKFLDRAWEWKEEYAATIRKQWAKLGLSLDYTRERFTLDEGLSHAVRKVFVDLYNDGLIYQGERIINWDPEAKTALSNIEVEHKEIKGHMYYFKYKVVETGKELVIATTRPETMFADQAIFVHPDDERYKDIIGLHAINPANEEELPIMADDYIDMDFGTAVMKCTPAHDPNDFMLAKKYNLLMPICMNPDGTMNEMAHKYAGMDRFECRKALVEDFEKADVVDHIEEHMHQVGHSQRTGVIVEPYLSKQWFVKMKPLADEVLKNQKIEDQKINFVPSRFEKTFEQWLENIEDWCISRQLWWGHRIPAWTNKATGEIYVGMEDPKDPENWQQDEDVLDTWFSSALWPFSTLGWPETTDDLKRYFPNDCLVTGYDIIFFWVARMAFQTRYCMKNRPFKDVLIHGLVRDSKGRKMSKSLGNGIDPMDVIQDKGADALRFFLTTNSTPGLDLRFDDKKMDAAWNFINKIWNAARFVQMQLQDEKPVLKSENLSAVDKWILSRMNTVIDHVTMNMDRYEFAMVGNELYSFVWDDFCSWYIELSKANLYSENQNIVASTKAVLLTVLANICKLLHPFMPFVTEEIYQSLPHDKESINVETWPEKVELDAKENEKEFVDLALSIIVKVREIKQEYNMKPSNPLAISIVDEQGSVIDLSDDYKRIIDRMCHVNFETIEDEDILSRTLEKAVLRVRMGDLVDYNEEKEKLEKEIERLQKEIKRASGMLNNPNFVSKAPQAKVDQEKAKLASYEDQLHMTQANLEEILKKIG